MDTCNILDKWKGEQGSLTAKRFLIENNKEFEEIIKLLTEATIEYLIMQIKAGADVIKIFDSWAGALNADMILRYSLQPIKKIVIEVKKKFPKTPFIVFQDQLIQYIVIFVTKTVLTF